MPIELILVIGFFLFIIVFGMLSSKNTINKMDYLENESVVHTAQGFNILQHSSYSRKTIFTKCKLVLTNKRIIVGQKIPFRDDYVLRFVFDISSSPGYMETDVGLKMSYLEIRTSTEFINSKYDSEKKAYSIPFTAGNALALGQAIDFEMEPLEPYFKKINDYRATG